jgi:glycosyltransferase involved in cell wall biosynthesis
MRAGTPPPARRARVLFLAWGYSIHAKRRIQLFADDPDFEVAVVSNCNYGFANARNFLLSGAKDAPSADARQSSDNPGTDAAEARGRQAATVVKLKSTVENTLLLRLGIDLYKVVRDYPVLRRAVKEFGPDVVFLQTLLYPCYLAYALPKSIPMMVTFWNGDVIWWAKWNGIERLLKKQIVTYGVRRAAAITVNSQMAFDACLGYGTTAERVHLIRYPGVDLERFAPGSKADAREQLGITADRVVLCPRGFGGYLNSDIIMEAAAVIAKKYSDTLFLFISGVGGNTELVRHQKLARELGIEANCRWDGQVPWETIPEYYRAADVMVSISSHDSLPNCMLEAMACAVPVVMGDIPQIQDWVRDGVNGILVPPRDAAALAEGITGIFENRDGISSTFTAKNLELVRREVDSAKNVRRIKELVHDVAARHLQERAH